VELAEEIFHLPVRLGIPQHVSGMAEVIRNPIHATGVGLLLFGHREEVARTNDASPRGGALGVWNKMRRWFQGNF